MTFSFKHRGTTHTASDLAGLSILFCVLRDASGEGFSTWEDGEMPDGSHISYNGRVWGADGSLRFDPANPSANDPDAALVASLATQHDDGQDLHPAAIHAAAVVVVAEALGVKHQGVELNPDGTGGVFLGQPTDSETAVLLGIAGIAADCLAEDPEATAEDIANDLLITLADHEHPLFGEATPTIRKRAAAMVLEHWEAIQARAYRENKEQGRLLERVFAEVERLDRPKPN
jgi:hypothetical protein